MLGHARAAHLVSFGGHVLYARRINPTIIEVEEAANGDGIVDGFFRPSGTFDFIHIRLANLIRSPIDFINEGEESFQIICERGSLIVFQNGLDERAIP